MKSRKFFIISGIILFVIILFFLLRNKNFKLPPPVEGSIIAFGDSLVYGYGSTEGGDFVSLLSNRVGLPIINAGIPGNTTADALERLSRDVLEQEPRIVIIVIGGNDFLRRVPKVETLANVRNLVEQINASGARIILVGTSRLVYDGEYEDIAKELGVLYVPHVMDRMLRNNDLMADSIHPNNAGYKIFADTVEPYFLKALED